MDGCHRLACSAQPLSSARTLKRPARTRRSLARPRHSSLPTTHGSRPPIQVRLTAYALQLGQRFRSASERVRPRCRFGPSPSSARANTRPGALTLLGAAPRALNKLRGSNERAPSRVGYPVRYTEHAGGLCERGDSTAGVASFRNVHKLREGLSRNK